MCEQKQTCGNCNSSNEAKQGSMNGIPEPKQVTCRKHLTPDPEDKNIGGVFIYADEPADKCPKWKQKTRKTDVKSWRYE